MKRIFLFLIIHCFFSQNKAVKIQIKETEIMKSIFGEQLQQFEVYLGKEERAAATIEKYLRDIRAFLACYSEKSEFTKDTILTYKKMLAERYKSTSANSMLTALNQFFTFCDRRDLQVKLFKIQRTPFREKSKELTVNEYKKLVQAAKAKNKNRLNLLIQTICSTGIRVSEHRFITVEALQTGSLRIVNKGKERIIFLSPELRQRLKKYCQENKILSGPIFITRNGNPMSRCNIWAEMKKLCGRAGVEPNKVFPHNLRHLFALTYYRLEKDIVRLADILGHTNIETTRIYTMTTDSEHIRSLSRLNLLL